MTGALAALALLLGADAAMPPVPAGWSVERTATGDLDGDGVADRVEVLVRPDLQPSGFDDGQTFDAMPRRLRVWLARGDGWRAAGDNGALIPPRDGAAMDDPLADLAIERGVVRLALVNFRSMGGWATWRTTLRLRHQDGAMRLIGIDRAYAMRNTGATEDISHNLLTGRRCVAVGRIDGPAPRARCRRIARAPLAPLDGLDDGLAIEP